MSHQSRYDDHEDHLERRRRRYEDVSLPFPFVHPQMTFGKPDEESLYSSRRGPPPPTSESAAPTSHRGPSSQRTESPSGHDTPTQNARHESAARISDLEERLQALQAQLDSRGRIQKIEEDPGDQVTAPVRTSTTSSRHVESAGRSGQTPARPEQTSVRSEQTPVRSEQGLIRAPLVSPPRQTSEPVSELGQTLEKLQFTSFYVRPGYGSKGRPLEVLANFFAVRAKGGKGKIIQ